MSDSAGETKSASHLSASVLEILIYHFLAVWVWGIFDPRLENSPKVEEWFGWVPANLGFWFLNLCFAVILAPPMTGLSMFIVASLRSRRPEWIEWQWKGAGRPPLLGSLVFVSLTYACIWLLLIVGLGFGNK